MRPFRLKTIFIIGLLVCSATMAAAALAQEFPPAERGNPGMAGGPGFQGLIPFLRLNLLQDQQESLTGIFEKYREMRMAYMDVMAASEQEMADIMDADSLDEENARAVIRKQAAVREEITILDIKMADEIKGVLSPEQFELLKRPGRRPFPPRAD